MTDPVVSHPAPRPETRRGPTQRERSSVRQQHAHARSELAPILMDGADATSTQLQTQLLASLERDAERKGTAVEPVRKPSPHVYFGEAQAPEEPEQPMYSYEVRCARPLARLDQVADTDQPQGPSSLVRPLHISLCLTWDWHMPRLGRSDQSLVRLVVMVKERVLDALLYQLDSVDRPDTHRRPWTLARSVLVWVPQSLLYGAYRRWPSLRVAPDPHTQRYPMWVATSTTPQRSAQWHLVTLTLPIMLLWHMDALVAALLEVLFVMVQIVLSVVA
ncbi:hypothetical protein MEQU1_000544 [Malassezia equina]|uniref:Uncharacterized protein n=1 Tax=Malassezia equina TaxID=1381935 RepID=A0AAF0EAB2_9BASI|nr:hypothetical protein MEQU1_000544 [Malassezia equina]